MFREPTPHCLLMLLRHVSFCGLVDHAHGRILSTNAKFDDAPGLDLVAWCRKELDLPLSMENDARLALLGEWYAGAAQECDDVVMITLGRASVVPQCLKAGCCVGNILKPVA